MGEVKHEIEVMPQAERGLKSLKKHHEIKARILDAIEGLAEDPRPPGCKKLKGQYDNHYRIRVGAWRILYAIQDDKLLVLILDVVPRDQAYR